MGFHLEQWHLVVQQVIATRHFCRVDEPHCTMCETYKVTVCSLVARSTLVTHKNIGVIDIAHENGIVMLFFSPQSTHKMQLLDAALMGPLSNWYSWEVKTWLWNNLGRVVTSLHIVNILGIAYTQAVTLKTASLAFTKIGVCLTDHNAFDNADFLASESI